MGQWLSRTAGAPNAALLSAVKPVPFEEAALKPDVRKHLASLRFVIKVLDVIAPVWLIRLFADFAAGGDPPQPNTPPPVETDITLLGDDLTPLAARIYEPPHLFGQAGPLLFFVHGGGFVAGGIKS